jgi:hypothetical protein
MLNYQHNINGLIKKIEAWQSQEVKILWYVLIQRHTQHTKFVLYELRKYSLSKLKTAVIFLVKFALRDDFFSLRN